MPDKASIEEITRKIEAGDPVTREEEKVYMMEVFGMSEREVLRIFAINDNERNANSNVIID